ncbi:UNVERIFIED_CONTAM: hypothetical protein GTU68_062028, partial [Idotea baltica]|nr:hypothetical protein [Idotea baltica]
SLKKPPFIHYKLNQRVLEAQVRKESVIKTWSRASTITQIVGMTIAVAQRKHLYRVCNREHVGHKSGEFSPTRTFRDTQVIEVITR